MLKETAEEQTWNDFKHEAATRKADTGSASGLVQIAEPLSEHPVGSWPKSTFLFFPC